MDFRIVPRIVDEPPSIQKKSSRSIEHEGGGRRQGAKPLGFAAPLRGVERDGISFAILRCLRCLQTQNELPQTPPMPPDLPKGVPKIDQRYIKIPTPQKSRKVPKIGPNVGPESAKNLPKSTSDAIFGLPDLKNEPPEGLSEKTCGRLEPGKE